MAVARGRYGRFLIGIVLNYMTFLLPVQRLRETETLIAFHHPQPSYPVHILLLPKRTIGNVMALQATDGDFLTDLFQTVQSLIQEFQLEDGYRLITNGGRYQDVPHLHFHLVAD